MLSASAASTLPGPQHADHHQDDLYIFRLGYSRDGMEQTTQNMLKSNWEAFLLPHFWRLHVQIPPPKKTVEPAKKNLSEVFTHRIHVWYVYLPLADCLLLVGEYISPMDPTGGGYVCGIRGPPLR